MITIKYVDPFVASGRKLSYGYESRCWTKRKSLALRHAADKISLGLIETTWRVDAEYTWPASLESGREYP